MKKHLYFVLPLLALSMLTGCGGGEGGDTPTPPGPTPPTPVNTFNVTWDLNNGTKPITEEYKEGDMPYCKENHAYVFVDDYRIAYFTDWDKPLSPVTEDITYTAQYDLNNPLKVATTISLIGLLPVNDTFKFGYTGQLNQVEWGDGKIDTITEDNDNFCEHTYEFPEGKSISVKIVIYGKLESFWLSDNNGLLGKANLAIKSVVLAETIKTIPDYGLSSLKHVSAVMLNNSLDYVGKYALKDISSSSVIYLQNGLNTEKVLQPNWNPKGCRVVEDITKLSLGQGEDKNFYGGVQAVRNDQEYFVLTDFYPYDNETTEKINIKIPDKINNDVIDAITYSPFFYGGYTFGTIELPKQLTFILDAGLEKTKADKIIIPPSVQEICPKSFWYSTGNIELDSSDDSQLYYIGSEAFRSCKAITEFTFPSTLKYLDSYAFAYCEKLETINNFENCQVKTLKEGVFRDCKFRNIKLPSSITQLDWYSFYNMDGLTVDASNFDKNSIAKCNKYAFNKTLTVRYDKELGDADGAKALFESKGWPSTATYTPIE